MQQVVMHKRLLGSGRYGVVYKGILNGSYFAIKKLADNIVLSIGHFQDGALALIVFAWVDQRSGTAISFIQHCF